MLACSAQEIPDSQCTLPRRRSEMGQYNHDITKLILLDIFENRICVYGDIDTDADVQATWTISFAANYDAIRITIGLGSPVQSGYIWQLTKPAPGHMGHDCHLLGAKLIKRRSWSWPMLNYVIL